MIENIGCWQICEICLLDSCRHISPYFLFLLYVVSTSILSYSSASISPLFSISSERMSYRRHICSLFFCGLFFEVSSFHLAHSVFEWSTWKSNSAEHSRPCNVTENIWWQKSFRSPSCMLGDSLSMEMLNLHLQNIFNDNSSYLLSYNSHKVSRSTRATWQRS